MDAEPNKTVKVCKTWRCIESLELCHDYTICKSHPLGDIFHLDRQLIRVIRHLWLWLIHVLQMVK